jgi:hypothetical protein
MAENNSFEFTHEIYSELFSITTNNYLKISSSDISFEDKDIKSLLERCNYPFGEYTQKRTCEFLVWSGGLVRPHLSATRFR